MLLFHGSERKNLFNFSQQQVFNISPLGQKVFPNNNNVNKTCVIKHTHTGIPSNPDKPRIEVSQSLSIKTDMINCSKSHYRHTDILKLYMFSHPLCSISLFTVISSQLLHGVFTHKKHKTHRHPIMNFWTATHTHTGNQC